jgi:hypothetical protein
VLVLGVQVPNGTSGSDSIFSTITSTGGGFGANNAASAQAGVQEDQVWRIRCFLYSLPGARRRNRKYSTS